MHIGVVPSQTACRAAARRSARCMLPAPQAYPTRSLGRSARRKRIAGIKNLVRCPA